MDVSGRLVCAALLFCVIAASPVPVRAASCHANAREGTRTVESRKLAREVNALGFEALSSANVESGIQDTSVSPFAIWYLDRFLDSNWRKEQNASAALLDELTRNTTFSATVWANGSKSTYTPADAAIAQQVLCASTKWYPSPTYDFSVTLSFTSHFELPAPRPGSVVRVPFFDDGSLRGVRLDSKDGATSVYLFWGTDEALSTFRIAMNARDWESLVGRFKQADVLLEDISEISLQRSAYSEWRPDDSSSFGTSVAPGLLMPRALRSNQTVTLSAGGSSLDIVSALRGNSAKPNSVTTVNGATVYHEDGPVIISDPAWKPPRAQRLSMLKPLIYVIENHSTGAILLIGIHE